MTDGYKRCFVLHPTLTNCTITGNGSNDGGGIYNDTRELVLVNSIVWGTQPADGISGSLQNLTLLNNNLEAESYAGTDGNISEDPMFVSNTDFHLQAEFPCINRGSTDALPLDTMDLDDDGVTDEPLPMDFDGNDRVIGAAVDMGAHESPHGAE